MNSAKQILTDDEVKKVVLMALIGKPQSEEQLLAVIKAAETMRTDALLLECILAEELCMYEADGEMMLCRPKRRSQPQPPDGERGRHQKYMTKKNATKRKRRAAVGCTAGLHHL